MVATPTGEVLVRAKGIAQVCGREGTRERKGVREAGRREGGRGGEREKEREGGGKREGVRVTMIFSPHSYPADIAEPLC